jgi:hypothetical protein
VRAKSPTLTAVRLATAQPVQLADGRELVASAGDYLITRGRTSVDVVGPSQLSVRYEIEERVCALSSETCLRLEQTTGIGSTRTPHDLVLAVERLAKISIGTIQIDFTPGQLEEITHRATKRGRTVQQELQAVVDRIREEIFWRS